LSVALSAVKLAEGRVKKQLSGVKMTAALTPRVRIMAMCSGVRESNTEAGVYDLKGVRHSLSAPSFPFLASKLGLYLLLASPRAGEFPAYVLITDSSEKTIFYCHLTPTPTFTEDTEHLACYIRTRCVFPAPGRYMVQVWFFQPQGLDLVKGELPFDVIEEGA
jgi:hypothetical protein